MPDNDSSPPDPPASYWTASKVLLGVVMVIVAAGLVTYIQWDEIDQITQQEQGSSQWAYPPTSASTANFDTSNLQFPNERVHSGGPPKDGIPSITDPAIALVSDADFMLDDDRVVGVTVNGESRAYPIKVLNYHECYNDTLGGVPIAVTFCPLCDSVAVVDRRLNGKTYEFGISGKLYNSNVLLYDRQDNALWSQVGLIAISGPNAGQSLTHLADWEITSFANWRGTHPQSTVATLDTGFYPPQHYAGVAYASYFQTDQLMFEARPTDTRFLNKYPVIGIKVGNHAKAYPVDRIVAAPGGRVEDLVGGQRVVLEATGKPPTVRIVQTPVGSQNLHTFWFAWYAFHPDTEVFGDPPADQMNQRPGPADPMPASPVANDD
jgi:Protein of unknown function (DUF3179)